MPLPDPPTAATDLVRRAVAEFESILTGYVKNLTGDPEMARDVVQDAFIRLYAQDPERVDGPGLKAWLFTVCRNRAFDLLRRSRRLVPMDDAALDHFADPARSPDSVAADQDEAAFVLRAFRRLPANQSEVLRLKFQSDLSYQEIAGVTGLSVSNVGFLVHTGLKRLRTLLAPESASLT